MQKICIFGPESTGKTTLAASLAKQYDTVYVPEFARIYLEKNNYNFGMEHLTLFAQGQSVMEEAFTKIANKVLICDTDPLTTCMWSQFIYQECDKQIIEIAEKSTYDHYLLMDIDVPFVEDKARFYPDKRQEFLDSCVNLLKLYKRPYTLVSGSWDVRESIAIAEIDEIMARQQDMSCV